MCIYFLLLLTIGCRYRWIWAFFFFLFRSLFHFVCQQEQLFFFAFRRLNFYVNRAAVFLEIHYDTSVKFPSWYQCSVLRLISINLYREETKVYETLNTECDLFLSRSEAAYLKRLALISRPIKRSRSGETRSQPHSWNKKPETKDVTTIRKSKWSNNDNYITSFYSFHYRGKIFF